MVISIEAQIAQINSGPPHLFILGAGASRAAFPSGDRSGKRLPLMDDLVEATGLSELLRSHGIEADGGDFEGTYSEIVADPDKHDLAAQIETIVDAYFEGLELPLSATLYDFLVLALRRKDMIATFNWDPLLMRAWLRNERFTDQLPHLRFLHGNVANGYCYRDRKLGERGFLCPSCGKEFDRSKLLYPVSTKDYTSDAGISAEWEDVKTALSSAFMISIFGYRAPATDVDALELMKSSRGPSEDKKLERIEILDIRDRDELAFQWRDFIYSHHYNVHAGFEDSWTAGHPRRTGEAFFNQYIGAVPVQHRPFPPLGTLDELWKWFEPLIEAEAKASP